MGLLNWIGLGKKVRKSPKNSVFDDTESENQASDTALMAQLTRTRREIARERLRYLQERLQALKARNEEMLLQDEIADLEGDDEDESDEDDGPEGPDALILNLLSKAFGGAPGPAVIPPNSNNPSNDENRAIKAKIPPAYISQLQKATDAEIRAFIEQYRPGLAEEAIQRAIKILRE